MYPHACRHRKVENKSGVSTFDLHDFMAGLVHTAHHRYAAENPLQVRMGTHTSRAYARQAHVLGLGQGDSSGLEFKSLLLRFWGAHGRLSEGPLGNSCLALLFG